MTYATALCPTSSSAAMSSLLLTFHIFIFPTTTVVISFKFCIETRWMSTMIVKIGALHLFSEELWLIEYLMVRIL